MQVSGEIDRSGSADVAADTKAVNWCTALYEAGDTLGVKSSADKDTYLVKAGQI